MQEQFEQLESLDEMFEFIAQSNIETSELPMPENTLKDEMLILNIQTLLKLFPLYLNLSEEDRKTVRQAAVTFNDPEQNMIVKQSALAEVCGLFFPEQEEDEEPTKANIQIVRRDKALPTPCEECEETPTHKLEFHAGNRSEEHYLCDECEEKARKEVEGMSEGG